MIEEVIADGRKEMEASIEAFRRALSRIRTGRANLSLLDGVRVDYYGTPTPLNQAAALSVPEPRLIVIKPWEQKMIPVIEKAILSDKSLGLNPSNDGNIIRLPIPELTEERRQEIAKIARHRAEEGRVAVRHARREGLDLLSEAQKDGEVSEDEARHTQTEVQKLTDEYVGHVDEIIKNKEAEIMEV